MLTIPKDVRSKEELLNSSPLDIWHDSTTKLKSETLCVKPARDGCSTGVARLRFVNAHIILTLHMYLCLLELEYFLSMHLHEF